MIGRIVGRGVARGVMAAGLLGGSVTATAAQATLTPVFQAPYRAFARYEVGASGSWVGFDNLAIEGQVGFGYRRFDVGLRGGYVDNGPFVLGASGRLRVVEHTAGFPLDGALILGAGTWEFDALFVPLGLSLGRRMDFDGGSVVLYAQPTVALLTGWADDDGNRAVHAGVGLGADVRIGPALDLRTSVGLGRYAEGLAVSIVWVH